MALFGLLGRGRHERTGFELYSTAVAAARAPYLYAELGVPDTLDGRFDLVALYACMLIRRLRRLPPPGDALAQAVFDAMFSDMDINLREMGVGDMAIARNVRAMWEAFHGRALAYEAALDDPDPAVLDAALARNVWRAGGDQDAQLGIVQGTQLGAIARRQMRQIDDTPAESLFAGKVRFVEPAGA